MADEQQVMDYIDDLEQKLRTERRMTNDLNQAQQSAFNANNDDNLVRWQLDLKEDLDRIYHLLRGDVIKEDGNGNVVWIEPNDPDLKPFNDFGVQRIMNIIQFYLNRNTLLSNYDENTINMKVYDFGRRVADLILSDYRKMMPTIDFKEMYVRIYGKERYLKKLPDGKYLVIMERSGKKYFRPLTDEEFWITYDKLNDHIRNKLKLYPMIVQELSDSVHSAYLRALDGGERESLRKVMSVVQNEPLGMMAGRMQQMGQSKKHFSIFNPRTWRG